jgi:hypothetical protein
MKLGVGINGGTLCRRSGAISRGGVRKKARSQDFASLFPGYYAITYPIMGEALLYKVVLQ